MIGGLSTEDNILIRHNTIQCWVYNVRDILKSNTTTLHIFPIKYDLKGALLHRFSTYGTKYGIA